MVLNFFAPPFLGERYTIDYKFLEMVILAEGGPYKKYPILGMYKNGGKNTIILKWISSYNPFNKPLLGLAI